MAEIIKIVRFVENGMYSDYYDVFYKSGKRVRYRIKGEMNNKHFDYMMNCKHCETIYRPSGKKIDKFYN